MSDPNFLRGLGFVAGWCLPQSHTINVAPSSTTTGSGEFNYLEWAQAPEQEVDLSSLITETDCPVCQHPPTKLNEAQDRCERDGRLTCYRCGWKGPV